MQLVLPFPEAIALATSEKPLPPQLERIVAKGSTIHLTIDPKTTLPQALHRIAPKVRLELTFRSFAAGVATFDLATNVYMIPLHRLLNFITKRIPLPEGIRIQRGEREPRVLVDIQMLMNQQVEGLELEEFYLYDGDFILTARIRNFKQKRAGR